MFTYIILSLLAVGVFYFGFIKNAPIGYEDETGFHYGEQPKK